MAAQERERREQKARLDDDLAQASARVAAEKQKARSAHTRAEAE